MLQKLLKLAAVPALVLSLGLAACADQGDPSQGLTGPEGGIRASNGLDSSYRIVRDVVKWGGSTSRVIGPLGGRLNLGPHQLEVPAGAVDAPTTFRIYKEYDDEVVLHLTASRQTLNDVGSQGFAVPLKLTVNYVDVRTPWNARYYEVAWVKPDGAVEIQRSENYPLLRRITAELDHFSAYALLEP